jgi:hypothetical protein
MTQPGESVRIATGGQGSHKTVRLRATQDLVALKRLAKDAGWSLHRQLELGVDPHVEWQLALEIWPQPWAPPPRGIFLTVVRPTDEEAIEMLLHLGEAIVRGEEAEAVKLRPADQPLPRGGILR